MNRALVLAVAYLLLALGLDHGVFAAFGDLPGRVRWSELRLLALGVILAGFLKSEIEAMVLGFGAAFIYAAAAGPGILGCSIMSFTALAWLASWTAKRLWIDNLLVRAVALWGLLVTESAIWSSARRFLWPALRVEIQWRTLIITAVVGALLYPPMRDWLRHRPAPPEPIGRRKPGK